MVSNVIHSVSATHGRTRWIVPMSLLAVLTVALILRLWGIDFGLPYEYHVDEVQYVRQAASMGAEGLQPVWWNNPPFYKYIYLAEYAGLYVLGRLAGWYTSTADFGSQHALDPTVLYLLGRGTTALFGVLTVLVLYWLGSRACNRRVGLLAAWFLATCFLHVRDSHYAVNDVPAAFFVTLSMLGAVGILQSGQRRWYIVAGIAIGLGFATKYSAVLAAIPALLAHLCAPGVRLRPRISLRIPYLATVTLAALGAAIAASPYFVLTPGVVMKDVYEALYLAGKQGFEGWLIDPAGGYVFYFKTLATGMGRGLLAACLLSVFAGLVRPKGEYAVLVSLPLVVYLIAGRQQMYFARFILPLVPALLVLAAAFCDELVQRIAVPSGGQLGILAVVTFLLTLQPLVSSIRYDVLLTRTDTRTLAKEWIEHNIPEGAKIGVDWPTHGPPLATATSSVPGSDRVYDVTQVGGKGLSDHSIAWYRESSFDLLIASSFISGLELEDRQRDQERDAFYQSLGSTFDLVKEFRPSQEGAELQFAFDQIYGPWTGLWRVDRPGPTLSIYRVQ